MPRHGWLAWLGTVWAIGLSSIAILAQRPPAPLPFDAPAFVFSAARAQKHVEAIAQAPHPMGSAEAERVRAILVQELKKLGLTPEIQSPGNSAAIPARSSARNIVARKRGQGLSGKKAIMLSAHYDSVPAGSGAGDNAVGIACILETLRALAASPPLERDLIVLFDDGEEVGFDGSLLFVDEHAWAHEVGLVLNLDARGNSGPSIMFETSDPNGWLVREYAAATPQPFATSFTADLYQFLPNDTDLTIYKRANLRGLNFAFVGGLSYYHTPHDTPANLSLRTLQHQGENTLACTRHFGQLDLDADHADQTNLIYWSILSRFVVIYPISWAVPLAEFGLVLFVALTILGARSGLAPFADVIIGAATFLLAAFAALLTGLALLFISVIVGGNVGRNPLEQIPWLAYDVPILIACSFILASATLFLVRWIAFNRSFVGTSLGALSFWLLLALATAQWLPGGSYLFIWPTIGGLLLLARLYWPDRDLRYRWLPAYLVPSRLSSSFLP